MNSKKIIAAFSAIIALVLGLYFLFLFLMPNKPKAVKPAVKQARPSSPADKQKIASSTVVAPQIKEARPGELSRNFPQAIPLYGQEKIIKSYDANYPAVQGRAAHQTSVVFESAKSMKVSYDYYIKWAKDKGWQIINQADAAALKFVYLRKGGEDINLTVTAAADKTKSAVSLSYVKF